jgi:hypothetical protein
LAAEEALAGALALLAGALLALAGTLLLGAGATVAAGAGVAGTLGLGGGTYTGGCGLLGMYSGPFWPQPASEAATRPSGSSRTSRRMARKS